MVIGNGFFSDSREAALREMTERSQCEVRPLPYPTIGNISYFVGYTGDLYGQQLIQGRPLTRQSKHLRWASGWTARFSDRPHHQVQHKLQVLTWSTFVACRWMPDVRLEFINGNPYDVRPSNLREQQPVIPPEWAETMERRKDMYRSNFLDVAWSVNYVTAQSLDDCKDAAQDAFIYLCCEGYMGHQRETDEFIGLWKRVARFRAIDRLKHVGDRQEYGTIDEQPSHYMRGGYEFDWFRVQTGDKRQRYLRMWIEGNTPTEIARETGTSPSNVRSSICRSMQFYKRYFKHEIEVWNKLK